MKIFLPTVISDIRLIIDCMPSLGMIALCIETIACTGIRISEIKYFTVEHVKSGKTEVIFGEK